MDKGSQCAKNKYIQKLIGFVFLLKKFLSSGVEQMWSCLKGGLSLGGFFFQKARDLLQKIYCMLVYVVRLSTFRKSLCCYVFNFYNTTRFFAYCLDNNILVYISNLGVVSIVTTAAAFI